MPVAGIVATNWWLLTKVGVKGAPLKANIVLLLKLLPLMVNVNWLPPAAALLGEIEVIDGAGWQ